MHFNISDLKQPQSPFVVELFDGHPKPDDNWMRIVVTWNELKYQDRGLSWGKYQISISVMKSQLCESSYVPAVLTFQIIISLAY